jgi:hypothetical protein
LETEKGGRMDEVGVVVVVSMGWVVVGWGCWVVEVLCGR